MEARTKRTKTTKVGRTRRKSAVLTRKQLIKKADAIFSQWIRLKYSTNGYVRCYTCGVLKPISEMQNGHYISRNKLATRFDEDNCRPQCVSCNVFKKGNYTSYALRLNREDPEILERLEKKSNKILKISDEDLKNIIIITKNKIDNFNKNS